LSREREYRRLVEAGNAAMTGGQTFEAVEAFSGAIALKNDSMLAFLRRGETYFQQGQLQAAERDLRQASHLDSTATRPLEALGDVHFELGDYRTAASQYADYVALDDQSPRLLYKLALARYRSGSPGTSVEPLMSAVALDENLPEAHYLLGLCYRETGRPDDARDSFERAVALAPAFIIAREELADLYREMRRRNDELDQLEALSSLDSRPVRRVALGLAQARAGRHAQAVETLRQAAERYPDHAAVYVALGRIWLDTSQGGRDRIALGKALEALEDAVARAGDTHEARALLGRALLEAGDVTTAERVLQQAVTTLPIDPPTFLDLADAAEQLGHLAEARSALINYEVLAGPDSSAARRAQRAARIADLSTRLDDHAAAADWLARAAAVAPTARLFGELAQAQLAAGDWNAAKTSVVRGLEIEPANQILRALEQQFN
jgi:tetratricopeptide (TPR) repeat protein